MCILKLLDLKPVVPQYACTRKLRVYLRDHILSPHLHASTRHASEPYALYAALAILFGPCLLIICCIILRGKFSNKFCNILCVHFGISQQQQLQQQQQQQQGQLEQQQQQEHTAGYLRSHFGSR